MDCDFKRGDQHKALGKSKISLKEFKGLDESTIEQFKQDEAITCFLASMRAGGEGLTLTEANHVLF